jgi:DnaJ-class molecular chaperone
MGFVLALTAAVAFGQLHICQKCGHENDKGIVACTHCKEPFPAQEEPANRQADVVEDSQDGYIPQQFVHAEIAEGQKHLQNQHYELARLFFLNALALEGVTDPVDHNSRSEKILAMVRSAGSASRAVRKPCPRCNGRGQHQVDAKGSSPLPRDSAIGLDRTFSAETKCRRCDGKGTVDALGTIDDMKVARGKAASEYSKIQHARRYEPLGGAWIPPHLADTLTSRQKATIMRSIVLPCQSCSGHGRSDCKRCSGLGRTECNNCNNGRVPYDRTTDRMQRISTNRTKECDTCRGTGALPCQSCDETGTIACKTCNGSGESDVCRTCSARGHLPCTRCRGSKVYRGEACLNCRGEGYILCTSCKGAGRRN